MVVNPFIPKTLVGHTAELQAICQVLQADGDFLLVGAPGLGRRTVLHQAALLSNARMMAIDCLRATSASQFLGLLAHGLADCFATPEELALIQKWSLDYPLVVETAAPLSRLRLTWPQGVGKEWAVFQALLALPQYLAEALDCRVVVTFQNFPHLRSWDRQGKWEAELRQEIQRQTRVSYALVSTVVEPWVIASNLAVIHLRPVPDEVMTPWLVEAVAAEGLTFDPSDRALALFLSMVQGHVGDATTLARRVWLDQRAVNTGASVIQAHHVQRSMVGLVADLAVTFEALLLLLPPSQVRVLESLALDPTDSPQSRNYIKKHQLSRGGGLQGALNSLEQKGLIYGPQLGYRIALPLFGFWLRQRLG